MREEKARAIQSPGETRTAPLLPPRPSDYPMPRIALFLEAPRPLQEVGDVVQSLDGDLLTARRARF